MQRFGASGRGHTLIKSPFVVGKEQCADGEDDGELREGETFEDLAARLSQSVVPIQYVQGDVRSLLGTAGDADFDLVIDKATLDSMMNNDDKEDAPRMLAEACRALRSGGTYACLSYSELEDREAVLTAESLEWDLGETREVRD